MSTNADSNQVYDLQKEWRAIVLDKLSSLEKSQADLKNEISDMKTTFANQAELSALKLKVDSLETFKAKAVGIIIALQAVFGVIGYLLGLVKH